MPLNEYANRCTATSKRHRRRCLNPAVNGYTVCRMHGARGGAPLRNRNAFKHGNETAVFRAYRSLCRARRRNTFRFVDRFKRYPAIHPDAIPGLKEIKTEAKVLDLWILRLEPCVYAMLEYSKKSEKVTKLSQKSKTTPCKEDGIDIYLTVCIDGKTAPVLDWIRLDWPLFYQAKAIGTV